MILLLHANVLLFGWPQGNDMICLMRLGAHSITVVAVNVFVLISGYFGISFRVSKIINLCYQVLFAVIPVSLLLLALHIFRFSSINELVHGFRFWHYWFINAYIGLVVFSPILNLAIKQMSQRQYQTMLLSLFFLFCIVHSDFGITPLGLHLVGGYSTIWFFFLYLLGRYIAIYSVHTLFSIRHILSAYVIGLLLTFLGVWLFQNASYNNPFIVLQSVALFLLFFKFSFVSNTVNFVASSSLMVFLLHRHPVLVKYYNGSIKCLFATYGPSLKFVLIVLGFCVQVYILAVVYDQLRKYSWSFIEPHVKKWDRFINL